jgi:hypothetical protein
MVMGVGGISLMSFAYDSALNMPSASRSREKALQTEDRREKMAWSKLMHVRLSYHRRYLDGCLLHVFSINDLLPPKFN